jgi:hypothetical protein
LTISLACIDTSGLRRPASTGAMPQSHRARLEESRYVGNPPALVSDRMQ